MPACFIPLPQQTLWFRAGGTCTILLLPSALAHRSSCLTPASLAWRIWRLLYAGGVLTACCANNALLSVAGAAGAALCWLFSRLPSAGVAWARGGRRRAGCFALPSWWARAAAGCILCCAAACYTCAYLHYLPLLHAGGRRARWLHLPGRNAACWLTCPPRHLAPLGAAAAT